MDGSPARSISVVVPTHNRSERLPALLDALAPQESEVVVVANACSDDTVAALERRAAEDPRLVVLEREQAGQLGALQAGVERAGGDVVLLLDDDVIAAPGLLAGHLAHHAARPGLVVLGYMPIALPARRRRGEFPLDLYAREYEKACELYEHDPANVLAGLWGGNVSLRREDALRVGLVPAQALLEGYGYHEDQDFGLRCAEAGLTGVFDRELLAEHRYERSPESFLAAARNSGATRFALYQRYGDEQPLTPDHYERTAPFPGKLLVRWARRRGARSLIEGFLKGVIAVAGALHLFRLESHAGFLLGTVEQQRGALDAAREAGR